MKVIVIDTVADTVKTEEVDTTDPNLALFESLPPGERHKSVSFQASGCFIRFVDIGGGRYFAALTNPVNEKVAMEAAKGLRRLLNAGGAV